MAIRKLPFASDTFESIAKLWVEPINRNECATVIGMNSREQLYRIPQFLDSGFIRTALKKKQSIVTHLNLLQKPIEDDVALDAYIAEISKNYPESFICVLVSNADVLLHYPFALERFNTVVHENDRIRFIFVFQRNITAPGIFKRLSKYTHIIQNTILHPLFKPTDINHFIEYKTAEFNVKIDPALCIRIARECGNELWLITEALRYFAKTGDVKNLFSHREMVWRIETLLSELEPEERLIMKRIAKQEYIPYDDPSLNYLVQKGYVSESNPRITVPLIEDYLVSKLKKDTPYLKYSDGRLFINEIDSTHLFTKREQKGLTYFLSHANVLIARNNLQVAIWGEEQAEGMTEWALDQQVKRIRDKLKSVGCRKYEIVTIKKQGFLFKQP